MRDGKSSTYTLGMSQLHGSKAQPSIEVVCSDEVAQAIARHLRRKYYDHYAMILFESDVRVLRPEKFD